MCDPWGSYMKVDWKFTGDLNEYPNDTNWMIHLGLTLKFHGGIDYFRPPFVYLDLLKKRDLASGHITDCSADVFSELDLYYPYRLKLPRKMISAELPSGNTLPDGQESILLNYPPMPEKEFLKFYKEEQLQTYRAIEFSLPDIAARGEKQGVAGKIVIDYLKRQIIFDGITYKPENAEPKYMAKVSGYDGAGRPVETEELTESPQLRFPIFSWNLMEG
ncbi:MAG: hypothetical protein N2645_19430 [Clostridia bacterium]|nr:hypothetical protein [Clostridia bacterium]